jgi:hypothetical protein
MVAPREPEMTAFGRGLVLLQNLAELFDCFSELEKRHRRLGSKSPRKAIMLSPYPVQESVAFLLGWPTWR